MSRRPRPNDIATLFSCWKRVETDKHPNVRLSADFFVFSCRRYRALMRYIEPLYCILAASFSTNTRPRPPLPQCYSLTRVAGLRRQVAVAYVRSSPLLCSQPRTAARTRRSPFVAAAAVGRPFSPSKSEILLASRRQHCVPADSLAAFLRESVSNERVGGGKGFLARWLVLPLPAASSAPCLRRRRVRFALRAAAIVAAAALFVAAVAALLPSADGISSRCDRRRVQSRLRLLCSDASLVAHPL